MTDAPVVQADPQAQPPPDLDLIPAAASSEEDLAREPHTAADAQEGPHPVPSQTLFVTMTKPDGDTFMSQEASVAYYEAKGYTRGAETEIENKQLFLDTHGEEGAAEPPPPEGGSSG